MSTQSTSAASPLYPEPVAWLLSQERLPELGPGQPNLAAKPLLESLRPQTFGISTRNSELASACIAGLWLLHDFLEESHSISQELHSPTGSYWHGIMHRREPDAENSKYWFRRIGNHPVLAELCSKAPDLGYNFISPFDFVDTCERCRGRQDALEQLAKRVQLLEWRLLFDYCYRMACS